MKRFILIASIIFAGYFLGISKAQEPGEETVETTEIFIEEIEIGGSNGEEEAQPQLSPKELKKLEKERKNREKKEEAERKKKEKKERKDRRRLNPQEIIGDIKAIEWVRPARTGEKIDEMYDDADKFFKMVKSVEDSVPIYTIRLVVSESGDSILAPVDNRGKIKHRKESWEQVGKSVMYGTDVSLQGTLLATDMITFGPEILAISLLGPSDQKAANKQISKGVKAFKLLKELIDSQNNMMKKYMEINYNLSSGNVDVETMNDLNINFDDAMVMSDEELEAWLEQENMN